MYIGKYHKYKIAAICTAGIQDDHLTYVINSISDALNNQGFKVLVFNAFTDFYKDTPYTHGESSIYHLLNFDLIDVLIILPETIKRDKITDVIVSHAKAADTPVISIDRRINGCTSIVYNYADSFEQLVRHIIEQHGCCDTFFVAGIKGNAFSEERLDAYKRVLKDNNIEFNPENVGYGDFWSEPTKAVMRKLIDSGRKMPEAIICANDSMAIIAARYLRENGYRVPDDVIVTGFDSAHGDSLSLLSELTSAVINVKEMAQLVADTAEGYFNKTEQPQEKQVSFELVKGQSCGCVPQKHYYVDEKLMKMSDYNAATQANESHISLFMSNAVGCKTLDEISSSMTKCAAKYSWVCINDDILTKNASIYPKAYHGVYTDTMISIIQRAGQEAIMNVSFNPKNILPDLGKTLKKYNKLLLSPLNFQTDTLGYYALVIDTLTEELNAYHDARRFVAATNQILQTFRINYNLHKAYSDLEADHAMDSLTNMYNRKGYFGVVEEKLNIGTSKQYVLTLSADMDYLNIINDNYGHAEGDSAIGVVADAIRHACSEKGICARFGGDEFVLTEPADNRLDAASKIEAIQIEINNYNRTSGKPYEISVSIGAVCENVSTPEEISELIRKSNHLMNEQKRLKKTGDNIKGSIVEDTINRYEKRIHEIFLKIPSTTYFYMDYTAYKWHIVKSETTPQCMISSSISPLRAIWLSGDIYENDKSIFKELILKIKDAMNGKASIPFCSTYVRLMCNGAPVWYGISVVMIMGNDNRLCELAGMVTKASSAEIMQIEVMNYYTTTENPLMITELIKQKLDESGDKRCAIIHFDIKRFKFINEKYGEEVGTQLLYNITRQLKLYCSNEQISARLNSDIFMLLTPYDTVADIYNIINDLQERLTGFNDIAYEFVFGVYLIDDKTLPPRIMGDRASIARHSIKNNAIENVAFYNGEMLQSANNRRFVETNMYSALENQQFIIYLQPKFSISRKEAVGYEALVRWIHPERGVIPPGDFIPLFEENGFILKLDRYVWECACQVLGDWIERGLHPLPISVNVSRAHLRDDSFIQYLDELIEKYRLPKRLLELEVTESIEGADSMHMTEEIKKHGYTLLMDDFGSGYSSLNTLKSTKFDVIKIDREFLTSFMSDERGKKIISHTISMSQDVGLDLIAEGVETGEQAEFLSKCGCDVAQGFFYARPMPVQEAEDFLKAEEKV